MTGSPELVLDLYTSPVAMVEGRIWESDQGQIAWLQQASDVGETPGISILNALQDGQAHELLRVDGAVKITQYSDSLLTLEQTEPTQGRHQRWSSDGTVAGTQRIADRIIGEATPLNRDSARLQVRGQPHENLEIFVNNIHILTIADRNEPRAGIERWETVVGDRMFFRVDQTDRDGLWMTAGTKETTRRLDVPGSDFRQLVAVGDHLVYTATRDADGVEQAELWSLDLPATLATNEPQVQRLSDEASWLAPNSRLHDRNGDALIGSTTLPDGQVQLWRWHPGQQALTNIALLPDEPSDFWGETLVRFRVNDAHWVTDGTQATARPEHIEPPSPWTTHIHKVGDYHFESSYTGERFALQSREGLHGEAVTLGTSDASWTYLDDNQGTAYFATDNQLWATDGTVAGTRQVQEFDRDIWAAQSAKSQLLVRTSDQLFATNALDQPLTSLNVPQGTRGSGPEWQGVINGHALFTPNPSNALWSTTGTETTQLLSLPDTQLLHFAQTNTHAYFVTMVDTGPNMRPRPEALWQTAGTPETTARLGGLPDGFTGLIATDTTLYALDKDRLFHTWNAESTSWQAVQNADGTQYQPPAIVRPLLRFGDAILLGRSEFTDPVFSLSWIENGQARSTGVERPISQLQIVGDRAYFMDYQTKLVSYLDSEGDLHQTDIQAPDRPFHSFSVGDYYTLTAMDGGTWTVWQSDGETSRELRLPEARPDFRSDGEKLYFSSMDVLPHIVYSTDGTADGTKELFRSTGKWQQSGPSSLVPTGEGEYVRGFGGDDGDLYIYTNRAVWRAPKSGDDTIKLGDLALKNFTHPFGPPHRLWEGSTVIDGQLLFVTNSPQFGVELFRLDTTPPPLAGDLDQDEDVDFADFLAFSAHYGSTAADAALADLTDDGQVDFDDFLLLADNFGKSRKQ